MKKRICYILLTLLLICVLPLTVLAAEYDLDKGNVVVSIDEEGSQCVNQNGNRQYDTNPTITGGNGSQSITVSTTGDDQANLTISNINAKTIEVGASNATITVSGENNQVTNDEGAGIHVSSGNLTITGDGILEATTSKESSAAIGSNSYEEMSGSITIGGYAKVTGTCNSGDLDYGAGIGTGEAGKLSGSITIEGNATVEGTGSFGAGIGSGFVGSYFMSENGKITESGSITIKDNAKVIGTSNGGGAGIGSGFGNSMAGTITIDGTANVTATATGMNSGAGIGSGAGKQRYMSGTISISDKAKVNASSTGRYESGDAIGAGALGTITGTIRKPPSNEEALKEALAALYSQTAAQLRWEAISPSPKPLRSTVQSRLTSMVTPLHMKANPTAV